MTINLTAVLQNATQSLLDMGYSNGTSYNLEVFGGTLSGKPTTFVRVVDNEKLEMLSYVTIENFLNNWNSITTKNIA